MTTDNNVYPSSVTYYPRGEQLMGPNLSLKEVLQVVSTASTNLVGKDLVLNGFDVAFTFTPNSVTFKVGPGFAVLDEVLIQSSDTTNVTLDSFQGLEDGGKFIVNLKFETYIVQQEMTFDQLKVSVNYVTPTGLTAYAWDPNKDRTVLEIFDYVLDNTGKLTSVTIADNKDIVIHGKRYYKNGYDSNNMNMSKYIQAYLDNLELGDITDELILSVLDREQVVKEPELLAKNYQNATQVNALINAKNYTTLDNVTNYLTTNQYVTNSDLLSRGFATVTTVNNLIDSRGYQTSIQVNGLIDTKLLSADYIKRSEYSTLTTNMISQFIIDGQYANLNDLNNILDDREFLTPDNIRDIVEELAQPVVEEIIASNNFITVGTLDARNYVTEPRAQQIISDYLVNNNYLNDVELDDFLNNKDYVNATDVQNILNAGPYVVRSEIASFLNTAQVNSLIDSRGYLNQIQVNTSITTTLTSLTTTDTEVKAKFLSVW